MDDNADYKEQSEAGEMASSIAAYKIQKSKISSKQDSRVQKSETFVMSPSGQ